MSTFEDHAQLERQVERIHQLLEAEGTEVTWNDKIPDPDKPDQSRQIDIAIKRDGKLTIVECRLHKAAQNVKWIEELIGRRVSLQADAAIAVSSSGFTSTAIAKAEKYGIILRDFKTLSRAEIEEWGQSRPITVYFCEFKNLTLTLFMPNGTPVAETDPKLTYQNGRPLDAVFYQLLLQQILQLLEQQKWAGEPSSIDAQIDVGLLADGVRPTKIQLQAKVRRVTQSVVVASVVNYVDPATRAEHATVGSYSLGASEVIEDCDRLALTIDLSPLVIPESCRLETFQFDAGRLVNAKIRCIGVSPAALNFDGPVEIHYAYPAP